MIVRHEQPKRGGLGVRTGFLGALSGRIALGLLLVLGALGLHHVAWPPVYEFPPSSPFAGPNWYNPYADASGEWLRTNFHAHSRAWGGLTSGASEPGEVRERYRELQYDAYPLSNYQSIDTPGPGYGASIPTYEHGYAISQAHQLVLGARRVSWLDFPLFPQGVRQKQAVLDDLASDAPVVIIAHPDKSNAYPGKSNAYLPSDMARLTGYTGLEIGTKFSSMTEHWDVALSAGRPVWGFCSDDGHDYQRESHYGIGWNMVQARDRTPSHILAAIRSGAFYGVWTRRQQEPNRLVSLRLRDGRVEVEVERPADEIRFVGQNGRTLARTTQASSGAYRLEADDSYVRTEVITGDTTLFLNPLFRYASDPLARRPASVASISTWAVRVLAFASLVALLLALAPGPPLPWLRRLRLSTWKSSGG